jgi:hypothetical protein
VAIDAKTLEQLRLVLQWLIANGGNVRTDLEAGGVDYDFWRRATRVRIALPAWRSRTSRDL